MSEYFATMVWERGTQVFSDNRYSRGHIWSFDGGFSVPASSSPHIVPLPYSKEENVDPEEAFVASIASCHMLFFLGIAAKKRYVVDRYVDYAVGTLEADESGRMAMTKVILKPDVIFSGEKQPTREQIEHMHHLAHDQCFIARSVKTHIEVEIP